MILLEDSVACRVSGSISRNGVAVATNSVMVSTGVADHLINCYYVELAANYKVMSSTVVGSWQIKL